MKIQTTPKTHTQKNGTIWEWEETPQLKAFIAQQTLIERPKRNV